MDAGPRLQPLRRQHFECDRAAQARIARAVNLAHPTRTQQRQYSRYWRTVDANVPMSTGLVM
jgi:hypothetical protein